MKLQFATILVIFRMVQFDFRILYVVFVKKNIMLKKFKIRENRFYYLYNRF